MLLKKEDSLIVLVDVQDKLVTSILNSQQLIDRCEWVLKLACELHVPIIAAEQYAKGLGSTIKTLYSYIKSSPIFDKVAFSCFNDHAFKTSLIQAQKKQIILIGIEAHVCILQTAFDLLAADYQVFVVVDAISSRTSIDLEYALKRMEHNSIQLITAEMLFFEWLKEAGSMQFKELSKAFF